MKKGWSFLEKEKTVAYSGAEEGDAMDDVAIVHSDSAEPAPGHMQLAVWCVQQLAALVLAVVVEGDLQGLGSSVGVEVDQLAVGLTSSNDDFLTTTVEHRLQPQV